MCARWFILLFALFAASCASPPAERFGPGGRLIDEEKFITEWKEIRGEVSQVSQEIPPEDVSHVGIARGAPHAIFEEASQAGGKKPLEKLNLAGVPLRVFARALANISGYNIVVDPGVNPELNIHLESVD